MKLTNIANLKGTLYYDRMVMLQTILDNQLVDYLQKALSYFGYNYVKVTHILDTPTIIAFITHPNSLEIIQAVKALKEADDSRNRIVRDKLVGKQTIMSFLHANEGDDIAWLPGEKGVTGPMGVYSYLHPKSEPIQLLKRLYKKYGYNFYNRTHARLMNRAISKSEREALIESAWLYYKKTYLVDTLDFLKYYPKSYLTLFSNNLNAGKSRGIKVLQEAVGAYSDGIPGKKTVKTVLNYVKVHKDNGLNQAQLSFMAKFYIYLCTKSKRAKHFFKFRKGWCNRLKYLGFKTIKNTCV